MGGGRAEQNTMWASLSLVAPVCQAPARYAQHFGLLI